MTRESALSNSCGFGLPCFVYSIDKSGSFATRYSMTTFFSLVPLVTLMPQDFLAEVAERYSGGSPQVSKHTQLTIPLNAARVESVLADEKPERNV